MNVFIVIELKIQQRDQVKSENLALVVSSYRNERKSVQDNNIQ